MRAHLKSPFVNVAIHASQFPAKVRGDLLASLQACKLNHKFLYDSLKQTQKWLALHQAWAPSRTDAECAATYDRAFRAANARVQTRSVHVIGLGCGGGQKDSRLLHFLRGSRRKVFYTPADVSLAMVLVACETAGSVISEDNTFPLVCDLAGADDLPGVMEASWPSTARVITFFGMLPNFESEAILPRLKGFLRAQDVLLLGANLAPGADYFAGVREILPQYDNALTRDWLMTFLLDLGVEATDGQLRFRVEPSPTGNGLLRVAAYFQFARRRRIQVDLQKFDFRRGESIRLFFSYRHTPALVQTLLRQHDLAVLAQWITKSGEEGIFLAKRMSGVAGRTADPRRTKTGRPSNRS
ncbi:conserved hypothetical protein [Verrucomicrobia bacterium]|nr:conserved hypothetical protein [Verrucomicrobiota bacterium]